MNWLRLDGDGGDGWRARDAIIGWILFPGRCQTWMSDDHRIGAGLAPEGGLFPAQAFAWVHGPPIKNPALKGLTTSSGEVNPGRDLTGRNRSAGPQTQGQLWAETKAPGPVSLLRVVFAARRGGLI